ncbi:cytochrome P450 [Phyllosticta citribraziliensis]
MDTVALSQGLASGLVWKLTVFVAFLSLVYKLSQLGRRDPRLPPGPPTLPVIGNLHQLSAKPFYKQLKKWSEQYGSVYSLKMGSDTTIVLNDRKAIHDLLDKKGAIYSDRQKEYVCGLVTHNHYFAFEDATSSWRSQRKIASHVLSPRTLDDKDGKFVPLHESEMSVLLLDLLKSPEDFYKHVKRTTCSVANVVVWGHRAATYGEFWGHNVYKALEMFSEAMEIGANPPVDQFPFLKWIPERFAGWKRRAIFSGREMNKTWVKARTLVEERRRESGTRPSIADGILDGTIDVGTEMTSNKLNHFLGSLVEGGADTTSTGMLTSLMQLSLHPEVQEKAREQLDKVCGSERLPTWSDFDQLPYINSIVKESVRWGPPVPFGIPHVVREDDWYEGMFIPKGSSIFVPVWALHHTEKNGYGDPESYNPDRWQNHTRLASELAGIAEFENRDHYVYGAGRRICPGMHLAERTMWRMTAKILWAYELIPVDVDVTRFSEGFALSPLPYKVQFKPRSEAHAATIEKDAAVALKFLEKYQ